MNNNFCVIKRNGTKEEVSFDKVIRRIKKLCYELSEDINPIMIAQKVCSQIYNNVTTSELDELAAQICISMETTHLDYGILASRIIISNNHKCTSPSFSETIYLLYNNKNNQIKTNKDNKCPLIADDVYEIIMKNKDKLNACINYDKDYLFDYFGFKTLEKSYLMKVGDRIVERIQHLFMRVSIGIHKDDLKSAINSYELISNKYFTHATPSLYNSGTPRPQFASCFLLGMEDSVKGIYKTVSDCAEISACAGGIGLSLSKIRSKNSYIKGTNGNSNGIIPLCRVLNETARHINQSGKRPGSIAVYIEPHNVEILEFLELRKNTGAESERARDLFLALWISDLFMKRVESDSTWSLFDSNECVGLEEVYGEEFEELYLKYEAEGRERKKISARKVWNYIMTSQIETGTPYMLYKDAINKKSNQKHYGTIKNSNLCVVGDTLVLTNKGFKEIKELSNTDEHIWNGEKFSLSKVVKTGENQKIIKVLFNDGTFLECTEYHKFYVQSKYIKHKLKCDILKSKTVKTIDAKDLIKGMKLVKCEYPIIEYYDEKEEELFKYAYTAGFHTGDGTYDIANDDKNKKCTNKSLENSCVCGRHKIFYKDGIITDTCIGIAYKKLPIVSLYGDKKKLLEHLHYYSCGNITKDNKLNVILYNDIPEKYLVPLNCSIKTKLEWLEGLCDSDGSLLNSFGVQGIQISSINKDFLIKVMLMLQTIGCKSKISIMANEMKRELPDGKGGKKMYDCKTSYRLIINGTSLNTLVKLGFNPKRLILNLENKNKQNPYKFVEVLEIIDEYKYADTYCFNEPLRNAGIFNGIFAGNCAEILEYSDEKEYAVCTLASISLPNFVSDDGLSFDFEKLIEVCNVIVRNLNKIIDINYYPVPETEVSNKKHRPLGIGVQGLSDVYCKMKMAFESPEAKELNKQIFETLYYGAMVASNNIAIEEGNGGYSTFKGSPLSQGLFQFDLWNVQPSDRYDWNALRSSVMKHGVANSLLVALMPTASTSQILGNNECFEPITSNIYTRRTIAGDFIVINKYLVKELMKISLWNIDMKNLIIANNGSVQNIDVIPDSIKNLYKTVWEIKQKALIDQSIERGPYVCQTQSMNLFFEEPSPTVLTSALFHGWKNGLKTGCYYIRNKPKAQAQQFTIDPSSKSSGSKDNECEMCSA
jgi:ribonucleoside-diphosphate reductase alpha chain